VFLERQAREAHRIVLPGVRVQRFVAEKIESPPVILVRTAARADIDPATRSASVLSRELIADDLHFFDGFYDGVKRSRAPRSSLLSSPSIVMLFE